MSASCLADGGSEDARGGTVWPSAWSWPPPCPDAQAKGLLP